MATINEIEVGGNTFELEDTYAREHSGGTYTAGTGIDITSNVISSTVKANAKQRYTVASTAWSGSANASGYYSASITLTTALSTSYAPNIYLSGSSDSTQPTAGETSAYNLLDYCDLSATTSLVLYAKTKPTTTFYINVEGQTA